MLVNARSYLACHNSPLITRVSRTRGGTICARARGMSKGGIIRSALMSWTRRDLHSTREGVKTGGKRGEIFALVCRRACERANCTICTNARADCERRTSDCRRKHQRPRGCLRSPRPLSSRAPSLPRSPITLAVVNVTHGRAQIARAIFSSWNRGAPRVVR